MSGMSLISPYCATGLMIVWILFAVAVLFGAVMAFVIVLSLLKEKRKNEEAERKKRGNNRRASFSPIRLALR
jgi:hypothetical protein